MTASEFGDCHREERRTDAIEDDEQMQSDSGRSRTVLDYDLICTVLDITRKYKKSETKTNPTARETFKSHVPVPRARVLLHRSEDDGGSVAALGDGEEGGRQQARRRRQQWRLDSRRRR